MTDPGPGSPDPADRGQGESFDDETSPDEELASELSEAGEVVLGEVLAERDQYLDALQRVKAEFDNYRRRTERERTEVAERAASRLGAELLGVLDACDSAIDHGASDVEPVRKALLEALGRAGLERMAPQDGPFDPNLHEAVMHEAGEEADGGESVVSDVLRAGYTWHGQVLRPAMVKVRG